MPELNKQKLSDIGGVMSYHAPLFSFNSIYDIDIGLVNLIRKKYLDERVFDPLFFKQPKLKIISDMYTRLESNPLTVFARPNISKEDLDDYYRQFLDKEYKFIYEECVSTEILNYIKMFESDTDYDITILCYTDYEVKIVKDEPILKNKKILRVNKELRLDKKTQGSYSEVFVKKVEEIELFPNAIDITFYISSFGPNFDPNHRPNSENPMIKETSVLVRNSLFPMNTFNIYDMYNGKYFERIE